MSKTAFITGASSGIGAEYARQLAAKGYALILHGRREEKLRTLCQELSDRYSVACEYLTAELSEPKELARLEKRLAEMESLDLLINNAGYGTGLVFHQKNADEQETMIRVHDIASVRLSRAVIPVMRRNGSGAIINVSSVAAFLVSGGDIMYYATKAFLNSLSESLHCQYYNEGIRVQALCPGYTVSEFHGRLGYGAEFHRKHRSMNAETVVRKSLRVLRNRPKKVVYIPGLRNKLSVLLLRLMPRRVLLWLMRMITRKRAREKGE